MGTIITAYMAREILKASSATVFILFVILVSNALGRLLADIADGDIPRQALWPVLLSQSIGLLSLLLPIGVFLGIVFAFGRMYKDHEIVVLNACGVGYADFYKPVLWLLIPTLAFSVYASIWLDAQVQRHAQSIVERERNVHEFSQIKAGQFNQGRAGNQVFFMESITPDRLELRDIIISESGKDRRVLETAKTGRQSIDPLSGDLFLVVGPGERYERVTGEREYRIIEFEEHGILLENQPRSTREKSSSKRKSPGQLWRSENVEDQVELHWRIAIPMVLITLALLAVPLAYIAPRQGRFGKVGYAILVYVAYLNLMAVTRSQLENEALPMALNFWWVHALFLAFTAYLLWRRNHGIIRLAGR